MNLPSHLFVASSGELFDTRAANWAANPLRANYIGAHNTIATVADLKAALRHGSTTGLGGYPLYFLTSDGDSLCFDCVRREFRQIADSIRAGARDGWNVVACEINYEESDMQCSHCGESIPCAYGAEEDCRTCAEAIETRVIPCDECGHMDGVE